MITDTFTVEVGGGASVTTARTLLSHRINVGMVRVVSSPGSSIGVTIEIFEKSTCLSADRIYRANGVLSIHDPVDRSNDAALRAFIVPFINRDTPSDSKMYIKVTNRDAISHTYTIDVVYDSPLLLEDPDTSDRWRTRVDDGNLLVEFNIAGAGDFTALYELLRSYGSHGIKSLYTPKAFAVGELSSEGRFILDQYHDPMNDSQYNVIYLGGRAVIDNEYTDPKQGWPLLIIESSGNSSDNAGGIVLRRKRGYADSSAVVQSGDAMPYIMFQAYTGPQVENDVPQEISIEVAAIEAIIDGAYGLSQRAPSALQFYVTNESYQEVVALKIDKSGAVLARRSTGGIGYGVGAGGVVTQLISKSTGVTLNKLSGKIMLHNEWLSSSVLEDAMVSFVVTDSSIVDTDVIIMNHVSGGTFGAYFVQAGAGSGQFTVSVRNISINGLAEAIVLSFAVIRGSIA